MTADRHGDASDPSKQALDAFEAALDAELGEEGASTVPSVLGTAFAAAFTALQDDAGSVEVDEAWRLPGSLDWLRELDVGDLTDPDSLADALPDDEIDRLELLADAVDELEWLATTDDSDDAGFTSSGAASFFALHHRGRVFSFNTNLDADPYALEFEHLESDADGRRQMLVRLIRTWLVGVGTLDVTLGSAFDDDLRRVLRLTGEENGGAPWDNGYLRNDLADEDDEDLARRAAELAPYVHSDESEILASLHRLRAAPDEDPAHELDRIVAWNVVWPDLGLWR